MENVMTYHVHLSIEYIHVIVFNAIIPVNSIAYDAVEREVSSPRSSPNNFAIFVEFPEYIVCVCWYISTSEFNISLE